MGKLKSNKDQNPCLYLQKNENGVILSGVIVRKPLNIVRNNQFRLNLHGDVHTNTTFKNNFI